MKKQIQIISVPLMILMLSLSTPIKGQEKTILQTINIAAGTHPAALMQTEQVANIESSSFFYNASHQTLGRYDSSSGYFYNSYGEMIGKLADDGTIYNASSSIIGTYRSGTFYNGNYQTVGKLDSDGTVRDDCYQTIGHIRNGQVYNSSFTTIGFSQAKASATAIFFFFGYF